MRGRRFGMLAAGAVLAVGASLLTATPAQAQARPRLPVPAANLGDSFASGQGGVETGPYLPGTDVPENRCHRSRTSPARLLAVTGLVRITADTACSGAVTRDIWATPKYDEPPQATRLTARHRLVFVTVGGNDVGFGSLVGCYITTACERTPLPAQSLQQIAGLGPSLDAAYDAVRAGAPDARVVVGLYPPLLPPAGAERGPSCPYINDEEHALGVQIQAALNAKITERATAHGFRVADPAWGFAGHDMCSLKPFFYLPATVPLDATLHPNLPGRAVMAASLAAAAGRR